MHRYIINVPNWFVQLEELTENDEYIFESCMCTVIMTIIIKINPINHSMNTLILHSHRLSTLCVKVISENVLFL